MNWPKDFINHVLHGNCLEIMTEIPDSSIDLLVTDPPYQLISTKAGFHRGKQGTVFTRTGKGGFMGKEWDVLPPVEVWQECLRVLKPGAFAFIMTTPRQDSLCQMLMNLTQAGFVMGFTSIYWAYASGFPKASNIGKKVDKRFGRKREIVGYDTQGKKSAGIMAGHHGWAEGQVPITRGNSDLEGSYGGFQPKPAIEVILVCMKPLSEKTYIDQALKNAKGITWLDSARIPYKSEDKPKGGFGGMGIGIGKPTEHQKYSGSQEAHAQGRFPANLLVDDDVLDGEIRLSKGGQSYSKTSKIYGKYANNRTIKGCDFGDSGSFSRYFSLNAWWEKKVKDLPESVQKTFPFLIVPKASKKEKNKGLEQLDDKILARSGGAQQAIKKGHQEYLQNHIGLNRISKVKNNHPTCKPIRLMSYLITLGSRKGDLILDPFIGSGTTCISAKILERRFIGIEKERDYVEIAKARLTKVVEERQGEFWE